MTLRAAILLLIFCLGIMQQGIAGSIKFSLASNTDTAVYMCYYKGKFLKKLDSLKISKGDVNFNFIHNYPALGGMRVLQFMPSRKQFEFLVNEQAEQSISWNYTTWYKNVQVSGGTECSQYMNYLSTMDEYKLKLDTLNSQFKLVNTNTDSANIYNKISEQSDKVNSLRSQIINATPNTFIAHVLALIQEPTLPNNIAKKQNNRYTKEQLSYIKNNYWNNIALTDTQILYAPAIDFKLQNYFLGLTSPQPDSFMATANNFLGKLINNHPIIYQHVLTWLLTTTEKGNVMGLDQSFITLIEQYITINKSPWLTNNERTTLINKAKAASKNTLGQIAPDILLGDRQGKPLSLYSKLPLKQYTIVVFYDPNCSHCKIEIPKLDSVVQKISKKYSIQIFGVQNSQNDADWLKFITKHNLETNWHHAHITNVYPTFRADYGVYTNPVIYLVNNKKIIVGKKFDHTGLAKLLQDIESNSVYK
jgi:thiol-disulfide isomerase/thioredoxin